MVCRLVLVSVAGARQGFGPVLTNGNSSESSQLGVLDSRAFCVCLYCPVIGPWRVPTYFGHK